MNDKHILTIPDTVEKIETETKKLGFEMSSDYQTGSLLRTLASTKPSAKILELGTGTGLSAAWMLDEMDSSSHLISVDNDPEAVEVAQKILGQDLRTEFHVRDGAEFLRDLNGKKFDLIFADTWPGKVTELDLALDLLADGGIYIVDDMSHQAHWDELDWDHNKIINEVIQALESKEGYILTKLCWSTGIILVSKKTNYNPPPH